MKSSASSLTIAENRLKAFLPFRVNLDFPYDTYPGWVGDLQHLRDLRLRREHRARRRHHVQLERLERIHMALLEKLSKYTTDK